jgi:glycosyltransferase involved in cell wall biosynthesis
MKRLLYISQKNRDKELKDFKAELIECGVEYYSIDIETFEGNLIGYVKTLTPTHILIHHNRGLLSNDTWETLSKISKLIWWVNDERYPIPKWIKGLVKTVDLWLVASKDTAKAITDLGGKAEYLIMGINPKQECANERDLNIVFTGQNSKNVFPLSNFRTSLIGGLKHRIKKDFHVYGNGWVFSEAKFESSGIYSRALIGLSVGHYNTEGTYSNRVLQIMVNGALCLMHDSKGMREIFGENVVYFTDVKDAFRKYNYLMANLNELKMIAENGRKFVENNLTWSHKAKAIYSYGSKLI